MLRAQDTPSCCTNRPGKNCVFVIRMMARDVTFFGCTSGSALRTSVVNTALSYGFVNCSPVDVTEAGYN